MLITSSIISAQGRYIRTRNSIYKLGRIDPRYRKWLRENRPDWDWRNPVTVHGAKELN